MEAIEFLKAAKRRYLSRPKYYLDAIYLTEDNIEAYVKEVEEWAKDHPVKTRQTEFLKMFPDVQIRSDGFVDIPPCVLDKKVYEKCTKSSIDCEECYKEFWNKEVE